MFSWETSENFQISHKAFDKMWHESLIYKFFILQTHETLAFNSNIVTQALSQRHFGIIWMKTLTLMKA